MGWQGRSWVYYKSMMEIAFEEKCVLPCVTGDATLASNAEDSEKKVFSESQAKVKQLIMASLSMELGQRVMMKETARTSTALSADVRDSLFINLSMRPLPANPRFDRLRGMVETGATEVDTPEMLKDLIIRMDSYIRCDRELGLIDRNSQQQQYANQGQGQKPKQQHATGQNAGKQITSERAASIAAKKAGQQQRN
ncbi:hypothetical protein PC128_g22419 [Phytophthora cactorum]|nr:hypothetical protein PC128_g22419 [Phytophthora cactorum]